MTPHVMSPILPWLSWTLWNAFTLLGCSRAGNCISSSAGLSPKLSTNSGALHSLSMNWMPLATESTHVSRTVATHNPHVGQHVDSKAPDEGGDRTTEAEEAFHCDLDLT